MVEKAAAESNDYRFDRNLDDLDPDLSLLIRDEEARQAGKLILIASESMAPRAVRAALGSVFTNIYAEGYPSLRVRQVDAAALADVEEQLALHRRYADRRYYKGTELVDLVEALAQRRVAELFATEQVPAHEIFANVQALSGAAANNAVYEAFLQPGDRLLGLALSDGGHLTHGSPYNRSGRQYQAISYSVDPSSGRLDYAEIHRLALAHRPKIIVAGASAYPWDIDWRRLRNIVDEIPGTLLLADIAHPAGLVAAGLFPNPVGFAHVVTFTTHKTLCGPRGAVILTTDEERANRIERAVFPGEQGGPHVNNIAAMAVAFRIARTTEFRDLQRQVVANAQALAGTLQGLGMGLVYGGTNTHLLLVDLNSLPRGHYPLKGDVASRILDVAGIVCNRNTISGDSSAAQASGLRFGTVWATQRGFRERDMEEVGRLIHRALVAIVPFRYHGPSGDLGRGKLPFSELEKVKQGVDELLAKTLEERPTPAVETVKALLVVGSRARAFIQEACSAHLSNLGLGESRDTTVLDPTGQQIAEVRVTRLGDDQSGHGRYQLTADSGRLSQLGRWLRALSDGYVICDPQDVYLKVEGPVVIGAAGGTSEGKHTVTGADLTKPYFVGQRALLARTPAAHKEVFEPRIYEGPTRQSALYDEHLRLNGGRNMVSFGGWTMPIWYTSIREEHRAVRQAAGLFDVSHMGVLEIYGPESCRFLDLVTSNYVPALVTGQSHYSYILGPEGEVLDDVFLYCRAPDRYMLVVNAANAEKIEAWLHAVTARRCLIDPERPGVTVDATAEIRNLKNPEFGDDCRVDLALQGPQALSALLTVIENAELARRVARLKKTEFVEGAIGEVPALISRTGYTGEEVGFELYIPPARAPMLWHRLLEAGGPLGLRPAGLGARDSTRVEAGFPLYGHELAGPFNISPAGAGYGTFIKLHKPFFIGRRRFIEGESKRTQEVVRFGLNSKGARMLRPGDPVVDQRGECIGYVTSCVAVEGVQVGLAYLSREHASPGNAIRIFPLSRLKNLREKPKGELAPGDTVALPEDGTILPRFGVKKG